LYLFGSGVANTESDVTECGELPKNLPAGTEETRWEATASVAG
jgi:hypothetical protein